MRYFFTFLVIAFVLGANAQNHLPTVDQANDQVVDEDSGRDTLTLTGITDGGDGGQALALSVSSDNQGLFTTLEILPGSGTARDLVFEPAADAFGSAKVTVTVTDDDGSVEMAFNITVNPVNDPPTIDPHDDVVALEDAGTVHVKLTGISSGPNEDDGLMFYFYSANMHVVDTFSFDYVAGDAEGMLNIVLFPDSAGLCSIEVKVIEDENILNATTIWFDLDVQPVDDPPTLDFVDDTTVANDGMEHYLTLTGISAGPANEDDQTLSIDVTGDNSNVLTGLTAEYSQGEDTALLKFTTVPGEVGACDVTVRLTDNGDLANGGDNSLVRTFKVNVINSGTPTLIKPLQSDKILLYPNPVTDEVRVALPDNVSNSVTVEIYSLSGEKVLEKNYSGRELVIPVTRLVEGMYQIKITAGQKVYSGRFLVK